MRMMGGFDGESEEVCVAGWVDVWMGESMQKGWRTAHLMHLINQTYYAKGCTWHEKS